MSEQSTGKLKQLERLLPEGLLVDSAWLSARNYYASLRTKYVASGWLEQPARRVYRRPRGQLSWQQVIIVNRRANLTLDRRPILTPS